MPQSHGKALKPGINILALPLFLFLAACAGGPAPGADKPVLVSTSTLPAGALAAAQGESPLGRTLQAAVNNFRASRNVGALSADGTLQKAAAVHAADMAMRNYTGHHNPEGQGPRERVLALNPAFTGRIAENIQILDGATYAAMSDEELAAEMVRKWSQSPTHRRNMQDATLTRSGIGLHRQGQRTIAVQVFAGG